MRITENKLYLAKGKLIVKARGYWFTAGGEKGSFGYYPHLKDARGYPLYPDTQVHGDLKMAAAWLSRLSGNEDEDLLDKVFGRKDGRPTVRIMPSLLRMTDLRFSRPAGEATPPHDLFQVKPRICIDDRKGTVKKGMLAYRELAWLEGRTLEADLYLGYLPNREELSRACRMVSDAARFLSGFGGQRSRGYGRGAVNIEFDEPEVVVQSEAAPPAFSGDFNYFARALVNFRNKGVSQSTSMQVGTQDHISARQFKGWFVRTYHDLFDAWPTDAQMKTIRFPELYPALQTDIGWQPAWPAAASTVRFEQSRKIRDLYGMDKADTPKSQADGKAKPLGRGWFVTGAPRPRAFEVRTLSRFRNRMDGNFVTKEKGLIAQELIPAGTAFGGRVTLAAEDNDFGRQARFIFENVKPEINGCLFEPALAPEDKSTPDAGDGPFLVTAPITYTPDPEETRQVHLAVTRSYSTILKRPRRNRIVLAPGSILTAPVAEKTVSWPGFAAEIDPVESQIPSLHPPAADDSKPPWYAEIRDRAGKEPITRTQAGLLREFLHPHSVKAAVQNILEQRREKHKGSDADEYKRLAKLDKACLECLRDADDMSKLQEFLKHYLEDLALDRWEQRQKNGGRS